ncbi:MAG: hypothetical protein H0W01_05845, partial [Pseudonocardiales bacterium]|nr:hypothetical protein [Pseudonocardiales bacterium]
MSDHTEREPVAAGADHELLLEKRRPGDELSVAEPGKQRDTALHRLEPGRSGGIEGEAGEVQQLVVTAKRPGGDHDGGVRSQQGSARGEDLGEP